MNEFSRTDSTLSSFESREPLLKRLSRNLKKRPRYTFMRATARFITLRNTMTYVRAFFYGTRRARFIEKCDARMPESYFSSLAPQAFTDELRSSGLSPGLTLPSPVVREIKDYALSTYCYADRDPALGFSLAQKEEAEERLGKPILVAQYFNTEERCPAIARLANDPFLLSIACRYLGSIPRFVGANLWWTFPVQASDADRHRHAHFFHRDLDDFRFVKFFFYLTDVDSGDSAHVCVKGSHIAPPHFNMSDRWTLRRYSDAEIESFYPEGSIQEICGSAGVGFAENTFCVHKGQTPSRAPRLLLQLQYALFDYGTMHDRRAETHLQSIT